MTRLVLLRHAWLQAALFLAIAVVGNHLASAWFYRLDVTRDQRFGVSNAARLAVARLDKPLVVRAFVTRGLEAPYHEHEAALRDLLAELAAWSHGRLEVRFDDPTGDPAAIAEAERFGVHPVPFTYKAWDRQETRQVFLGVAFVYGERQSAIDVLPSIARMEYEVVRAIHAITTPPESAPVIGWVIGHGEPDPARLPANHPLLKLKDALAAKGSLRTVVLGDDPISSDIDALLLVGPQEALPLRQQLALDQFVMAGKPLAAFLAQVQPDFRQMQAREVRTDLSAWLGTYGVVLGRGAVLDRTRNAAMQLPVVQAGRAVLANVNTPLAPTTTAIDRSIPAIRAIPKLVLPFAGPVELAAELPPGVTGDVWVRALPSAVVAPLPLSLSPEVLAQPMPGEAATAAGLGVGLEGQFPSFFAARPLPPAADPARDPFDPAELVTRSAPTRLVVFGSADFVANAPDLVTNAVDWLLEDESLIGIPRRDGADDPLEAPPAASATRWKLAIAGPPLLLLAALGIAVWARGRAR